MAKRLGGRMIFREEEYDCTIAPESGGATLDDAASIVIPVTQRIAIIKSDFEELPTVHDMIELRNEKGDWQPWQIKAIDGYRDRGSPKMTLTLGDQNE